MPGTGGFIGKARLEGGAGHGAVIFPAAGHDGTLHEHPADAHQKLNISSNRAQRDKPYEEIGEIERRLKLWHRDNAASRRIAEIPGVGVLSATAAVAAMGDPSAFKSGREFAAWLGLVPRHEGTGGRVRMLGISKRGDTYLRTLLIHGARSVFSNSKAPPEWALRVAERRPANVATVALANKMARTIWALLAHDRAYHANFDCQAA